MTTRQSRKQTYRNVVLFVEQSPDRVLPSVVTTQFTGGPNQPAQSITGNSFENNRQWTVAFPGVNTSNYCSTLTDPVTQDESDWEITLDPIAAIPQNAP